MVRPDPPTRTGFTRPFHQQQILSWVGYLIQLIVYILLILPCMTRDEKIGISIPYLMIFALYNTCFLLASKESHTSAWISEKQRNKGFNCRWCDKYVKLGAKHCRSCNICRLNFDHHCFFLNNCVTSDNYQLFLSGIILLGISSIFTTFLCIFVIMGNEYDDGALMQRASEFYGGSKVPKALVYVFLCLLMIEMLGIQVFMIYLFALHYLLFDRGITTFELIQYRRQLENEKAANQ
ncbi:hypothetical protein TRFO_08709 [Tritrichomonas foetus]|uniref:Palmitoyltransferase n=1 Tax=Tritrichomonas foetus TaxID=1144522 RepID=A0A1J4JMF2_9EUKA|nr:hypothetical protein TRFO_08709 [Tritrichomonas foetus]|eukprot:OHS98717.1 hypothetical protein TRFO_08709 [Tritrichomonas foetus]